MLKFTRLMIALSPLALAACAAGSGNWSHAELPKNQWSRDYGTCRNAAEDRVIGYDDRLEDSRSSNPMTQYDRDSAKRRIDGLIAACMAGRGYTRTGGR